LRVPEYLIRNRPAVAFINSEKLAMLFTLRHILREYR
jgi:hypothetical protein